MDKGREEGLERLDVEWAGLKYGEGVKGMGWGSHTVHVIKAEEMNKEKHTYPKAADRRRIF